MFEVEGEISILESGDLKITCTTLSVEDAKALIADLISRGYLQLCGLFTTLVSEETMFAGEYDCANEFAVGLPVYDQNDDFVCFSHLYFYEYLDEYQIEQLLTTGILILPSVTYTKVEW